MKTFQEMGLPEALNHTLQHMQFTEPTPIQSEAIPIALKGQDILGSAQTGTGKTAAFGIPLIASLLANPYSSALVMTPTRELATQVMSQLQLMLGRKSKIKSALLIGGDSMNKQLNQLSKNPRVIVATPGRINDHLQRESVSLHNTDFLVLDETDRMLDMGFLGQIENVMDYMADKRQTLLFSATLPQNIVNIAEKYLTDPARVSVNSPSSPAANIQQDNLLLNETEKYPNLLSQLDEREGSILVFVQTKYKTEKMAKKLAKEGYSADAIHGNLRQNKRDQVIKSFRNKEYRILVATDVAARGLDIPHIEHIINYDIPQCPEDYIHRIGRTARAGAKGAALNFVTPADKGKWNAIDCLLNPDAHPKGAHSTTRQPDKKKRSKGKGDVFGFSKRDSSNSSNSNKSSNSRNSSNASKSSTSSKRSLNTKSNNSKSTHSKSNNNTKSGNSSNYSKSIHSKSTASKSGGSKRQIAR